MPHLFDDLLKQGGLHPEAAALASVDGKTLLTYRQLLTSAETAAAWLRANGARADDCLALCISSQTVLHGVILLAALRVGALVASLGNRRGAEWSALEKLKPRVVTAESVDLPFVPATDCLSVSAVDVQSFQRAQRVIGLPALADVSSTAGLVLFGGTTGHVCALRLSMDRLVPRLRDLAARLRLEPGRKLGIALPASTAFGLEATLACWLVGGCVVFPGSVPQLRHLLRSGADDVAVSGPVLRTLLTASEDLPLTEPLGRILVVGGPLSSETAELARKQLRREPHLLMASAETGLFSWATKADLSAHSGSVGRPAGAADVQAVDALGRVRPVGQDGLIRVTTPWMATSIVDDPRSTGPGDFSDVRDGWWSSGLRGAIAPDGRITISGVLAHLGRTVEG